jgi:hypothetical protein
MLRHSPRLTSASLAARRANALKSTGPRTEQGKAWSCLNALRHGRRARSFRTKLERTRDRQAIFLFDYILVNLLERWKPPTDWEWNLTAREAVRAWCFLTGRMLLPRLKANGRRVAVGGCPTYRYSERLVCPTNLQITAKNGIGIRFRNPIPSRRKHVNHSWLPTVELFEPPPRLPRAKRVRRTGRNAADLAEALANSHSPLATAGNRGNRVEGTGIHGRTKLECDLKSAGCLENPAEAPAPLTGHPPLATSSDCGNAVERTKVRSRTKLECDLESVACPETSAAGSALATRHLSLGTALKGVLARAREVLRW